MGRMLARRSDSEPAGSAWEPPRTAAVRVETHTPGEPRPSSALGSTQEEAAYPVPTTGVARPGADAAHLRTRVLTRLRRASEDQEVTAMHLSSVVTGLQAQRTHQRRHLQQRPQETRRGWYRPRSHDATNFGQVGSVGGGGVRRGRRSVAASGARGVRSGATSSRRRPAVTEPDS